MAVIDPYATTEEYRARVDKSDTSDDAILLPQLKAASRFIRHKCGRFFTKDASAVARLLNGSDAVRVGTRLLINDVADLTGLVVKVDLDGDHDFDEAEETLTKGTHYWVGPANADKGDEPEPYRWLDIMPNNGRLVKWTDALNSVEVTAIFGWPSVPEMIAELTVGITRQIHDLQISGATLQMANIESAISMDDRLPKLLYDAMLQYGRKELFA
ncbi:hypothetical protein LCGC14_1349590 [marine sediment metagenome]|uniref:Uncharacterized protein n=1 Tax=marine sediment metagenome TaxID=412755 RepID=A0A0F9NDJ9_9ZZZZ